MLRSKRIRQEQEYIDRMLLSVEENLKNTKEEQRINEEFEEHIRREVYRMHGISEDKLQGMTERKTAWYQGAAFALFFLSLVMIALCGILHGFGSEICIFMAFYTAIEGTLLSNGRKGITQKQLAEKTGIYQADISKIERGLSNPSISTLQRLAEGMGLQIEVSFK